MSIPFFRRAAGLATVLALTISLAACGDDEDDASQDDTSQQNQQCPPRRRRRSRRRRQPRPAPRRCRASLPSPKNAEDPDKEPVIAKGTGDAPTSLVIRDLLVGNGEVARPTDTVEVRYVGALYKTGEVFDASWKNGTAPIEFALSRVVPGFAGGIVGMKLGGRREIVIPAALGYGDVAQPGLPAGSVLVFVVDLTGISRPDTGQPDSAPGPSDY